MAQAEALYRQILTAEPGHAETCNLLGVLSLQTGRPAEAVSLLELAVAGDASDIRYRGNLGAAYFTAKRYEDARTTLERTVRDDPANPEGHYNLAATLAELNRFDEAEVSYDRCLRLQPDHSSTRNNLGNMLREQGRYDEALVHLDRALTIDPKSAYAHYNRALVWLSLGRLTEGWAEYEWRWYSHDFKPRHQNRPQWDGRPLDKQMLVVHAEQGLGDTIQFVRYLGEVRRRSPTTIVEVQPSLIGLLRQSGIGGLVAQGAPLPPFDVQIPMASLPLALGTTPATIPADIPYLQAHSELAAAWRDHLSRFAGFKIGIAWQGNPTYREDRFRSIALAEFAPLAEVPGVRLFSLQKGPGVEQLASVKQQLRIIDLGTNIDVGTGPFLDTAAIMKSLDLVITSDTVSAHLAGALGVRVWVALRRAPDWRWLAAGDSSPWYPTMRLFRQRALGDWPQVFRDMADELGRIVSGEIA